MKVTVDVAVRVVDGGNGSFEAHRREVVVRAEIDAGSAYGREPVVGSIEKALSEARRIVDQAGTELDPAAGRGA